MNSECKVGEHGARDKRSFVKFLPSTITITGFCFGLTSIRFALFQQWEYAVLCVFISALLDAFDGRVARAIGQSSQLGAELDSLSDLVCFGVAPAIILFLRTMYLFGGIGWAVCMFFTVCCALRLARFNAALLENNNAEDWEKKFFTGVPAPAGAMIALLPLTAFFETERLMFLNPGFVAVCLMLAGIMMISTLRTFSSKMVQIDSGSAVMGLIAITLCVICLITDVWLTLSLFTVAYILAIPCGVFEYNRRKEESAGVLDTKLEDRVDESAKKDEQLPKLEYQEKDAPIVDEEAPSPKETNRKKKSDLNDYQKK